MIVIRNPCKKCIVRACCTLICEEKKKHSYRIQMIEGSIYIIKRKKLYAYSWFKKEWPILFGLSVIALEIYYIVYISVRIVLQ